jgi:hypothetical protein
VASPLHRDQNKPSVPILPLLPPSSKILSTSAIPLSRDQETCSPTSSWPPSGSEILSSSQRRSEVGFVSKSSPEPFRLSFERAPVWLLALEPSICSATYIMGVKSATDLLELLSSRGEDPTLFNRAVTQLGVTRVHFCGNELGPNQATTLISGSYPFLQRAAINPGPGRTIFLLDEPWPGKTKPKYSALVTWQRLKPTQFGGSANFPVLVGSSGFRFSPQGSSLARNVGHILDHSIRPVGLTASEVKSLESCQDFYVAKSLVDPRYLERPVAYQTSYSSSNWGSRMLTAEEIGISFGLPGRLRLGGLTTNMFPFVPVQVVAGCLDSLGNSSGRLVQPLSTPGPQVLAPIPTGTWLKSIGKRLDHAWIDQSAVSAKAAKATVLASRLRCGTVE